ncbi:hypothetical protein YPPY04_1564, partial [Yersinia pestis PY-04]
MYRLGG